MDLDTCFAELEQPTPSPDAVSSSATTTSSSSCHPKACATPSPSQLHFIEECTTQFKGNPKHSFFSAPCLNSLFRSTAEYVNLEQVYLKPVCFWHPAETYGATIRCVHQGCTQQLRKNGYTQPRLVHDIEDVQFLISYEYYCSQHGTFNTCNPTVLSSLPLYVQHLFDYELREKIAFTKRCAQLLFATGTSRAGLSFARKVTHEMRNHRFHRLQQLYYSHCIAVTNAKKQKASLSNNPEHIPTALPPAFSTFITDPDGYRSSLGPTDHTVTDVIFEQLQSTRQFQEQFLQTHVPVTKVISLDHSYKTPSKFMTMGDNNKHQHVLPATLTVLNAYGQVIAQRLVPNAGSEESMRLLTTVKQLCDATNQAYPEYCWTDNCCHDRDWITSVFEDIQVRVDLWHVMQRYWRCVDNKHGMYKDFCRDLSASFYSTKSSSSNSGNDKRLLPPRAMIRSVGQVVADYLMMEQDVPTHKRLINKKLLKCHEQQCRHMILGCLRDVEGDVTVTYANGKQTRISRGTNGAERLHLHQNVNSNRCGAQLGESLLFNLVFQWNVRKHILITGVEFSTYDMYSLHQIQMLYKELCTAIRPARTPPALYGDFVTASKKAPSLFGLACFTKQSNSHSGAQGSISDDCDSDEDDCDEQQEQQIIHSAHALPATRNFLAKLTELKAEEDRWSVDEYILFRRLLDAGTKEYEQTLKQCEQGHTGVDCANNHDVDSKDAELTVMTYIAKGWTKALEENKKVATAFEESTTTQDMQDALSRRKHLSKKSVDQLLEHYDKMQMLGYYKRKEIKTRSKPPQPYIPLRYTAHVMGNNNSLEAFSVSELAEVERMVDSDETSRQRAMVSKHRDIWQEKECELYSRVVEELREEGIVVLESAGTHRLLTRICDRYNTLVDEHKQALTPSTHQRVLRNKDVDQCRNRFKYLRQKHEGKRKKRKIEETDETEDTNTLPTAANSNSSNSSNNSNSIDSSSSRVVPLPPFIVESKGKAFTAEERTLLSELLMKNNFKQKNTVQWAKLSGVWKATVYSIYQAQPKLLDHPKYFYRSDIQLRDHCASKAKKATMESTANTIVNMFAKHGSNSGNVATSDSNSMEHDSNSTQKGIEAQ